MSRQQRRQSSRQGKTPFPWEKLIISVIVALFVGTVAFTYFFPAINARSYATGSARVQKIIITRGMEDLQGQAPYEYLYVTNEYPNDDEELTWAELKVEETASSVLIYVDKEDAEEYPLQSPPEYYTTVQGMIPGVQAALKDRTYKVRHPEPENKDAQTLILEKKKDEVHTGYIFYFTADHQVDSVHFFEKISEEKYTERVYSGLITGVPEGYGEETEEDDDEGSDD